MPFTCLDSFQSKLAHMNAHHSCCYHGATSYQVLPRPAAAASCFWVLVNSLIFQMDLNVLPCAWL